MLTSFRDVSYISQQPSTLFPSNNLFVISSSKYIPEISIKFVQIMQQIDIVSRNLTSTLNVDLKANILVDYPSVEKCDGSFFGAWKLQIACHFEVVGHHTDMILRSQHPGGVTDIYRPDGMSSAIHHIQYVR